MTATPATMSAEESREILETNRFAIVEGVNCERTLVLNYLRNKKVFDEEDCELVQREPSNRARASKLVDFLMRKGPDAYQHFLDVVQVENSSLYETLTGTKSTSKPSELMRQIAGHQIITEGVSGIQVQQLLAEHLQRTYADLQDIAARYGELVKSKQAVEEQLVKTEQDLEFEKARQKKCEELVTSKVEFDENVENENVSLLTECDNLEKGLADRDVYIIVLQMNLLAEKDECNKLRSKLDETQCKNDEMARELRRISENYNHERSQSIKLSECIRLQDDEMQKINEMKKRLRESKFENILMQEERDCIAEELKELKKWAALLNARFDVIEREKYNFVEKSESATTNCTNLQESVRALHRKLVLSQADVEDRCKRNELLANDSEIFKKQRDCALEARKEMILERDKSMSENAALQKQYNELQEKRDQMNEEMVALIQEHDAIKVRYNMSLDELTQVKKRLNEKELEADDLSRRLNELELEKGHRNSHLLMPEPESQSTDESGEEGENPAKEHPWKERRLKSLLKSMKHRIAGERVDADEYGNMSLQVLHCLLPNISSSPYSTLGRPTVTRTLQRQIGMRKHRSKSNGNALEPTQPGNKFSSLPADIRHSHGVLGFVEEAESDIPEAAGSSHEVDETLFRGRFRQRAKCVSKKYVRSQSAEQ